MGHDLRRKIKTVSLVGALSLMATPLKKGDLVNTLPRGVALDLSLGVKAPTPNVPPEGLRKRLAENPRVQTSLEDIEAKQEAAALRREQQRTPKQKKAVTVSKENKVEELSRNLSERLDAATASHAEELARRAAVARRETDKASRAAETLRRSAEEKALMSAEKQRRAAKNKETIDAQKVSTARKLGNVMTKAERQAETQAKLDAKIEELKEETEEKLRLATERAVIEQQRKVESAKKFSEGRRAIVLQKKEEQEQVAQERKTMLETKIDQAAQRSKIAELEKVKKARKELDKVDQVLKKNKMKSAAVVQVDDCFFDPPHDDPQHDPMLIPESNYNSSSIAVGGRPPPEQQNYCCGFFGGAGFFSSS